MADMTFFEPVHQFPVDFHGTEVMRPVFYPDFTGIQVLFLTPVENIRTVLPSQRLRPMRFTPRSALTVISVVEHRESGVGPYSLAFVGFPVTVDKDAPILRGALEAQTSGAGVFIWQMPENSELPIASGVEVVGYPKFMATVELGENDGWISGRVEQGGHDIFTLSTRVLKTRRVDNRYPGDIYVYREPWIRRIPFVTNFRHVGRSIKQSDARLELGDHPVAEELRRLELGRPVSVQYTPDGQQVLGSTLEGWSADRPVERWAPE